MTDLTRPIIGIENRTAQEAFDIMCDRIRHALATQHRREAEAGFREFAKMVDESPHPERSAHLSADARAQAAFAMLDNFKRQARALAASPSSPASGVRVKALRWNPFEANTSIGRYHVADHRGEDGLFGAGLDGNVIGRFGSVSEAKAAAQADYEARIRSAIGEHP